jgi:hypothetical protein
MCSGGREGGREGGSEAGREAGRQAGRQGGRQQVFPRFVLLGLLFIAKLCERGTHRDLKLGNVLVDNARTPNAKICDFGLARLAQPTDMTSFIGTASYMAPCVHCTQPRMPTLKCALLLCPVRVLRLVMRLPTACACVSLADRVVALASTLQRADGPRSCAVLHQRGRVRFRDSCERAAVVVLVLQLRWPTRVPLKLIRWR